MSRELFGGEKMKKFLINTLFIGLCLVSPVLAQYMNPQALNYWCITETSYISDQDQFGVLEYYQSPEEFVKNKQGDCEDYGIYINHYLTQLNYETKMYVVQCPKYNGRTHIINVFKQKNVYLIFSNGYLYDTDKTDPIEAIKEIYPTWVMIGEFYPKKYGPIHWWEKFGEVKTLLRRRSLKKEKSFSLIHGYDLYQKKQIKDLKESVIKEKISESVQSHTVSIFGMGQGFGFCSGVIIGENSKYTYVLTCKHCVHPTEEVLVENTQADAVIALMNEDLALVLIKGSLPGKSPSSLASEKPKKDQELIHIGYPKFDLYESWGKVLRTSKDWQWASFESQGGCSGGGVYNRQKQLVGILWGGLGYNPISIYEPIDDIRLFLNKIQQYIHIK